MNQITFLSYIFLALNLPFIICSLYYVQQGGCTDIEETGISFTLGTWLLVDALGRISILFILLINIILAYSLDQAGAKIAEIVTIAIFVLYFIFRMLWFYYGAAIFWGHLNNKF